MSPIAPTRVLKSRVNWLIGKSESNSLSNHRQLPLMKSVMARYCYFRSKKKSTATKDILKEVLSELKILWQKADIPIKKDCLILHQLLAVYNRWVSLKKIKKNNLSLPKNKLKILSLT